MWKRKRKRLKNKRFHIPNQYGVFDNQPVGYTLFWLKMAPVEDRNVSSMFLTSCLAVIFGLKSLVFSNCMVCVMIDCAVRCTKKQIEMSCRAIQKVLAFFCHSQEILTSKFMHL